MSLSWRRAWAPRSSGSRPLRLSAAWLAVVGARDFVFGGYVFALALLSTRRAVGVVLGVTALIPLGDILVLLAVRGVASPGHLLLHLGSPCAVAITAAWTLRHPPPSAG